MEDNNMENTYFYGIRQISTGKIKSTKCAGGKFYKREGDAKNKCPATDHEVVRFRLEEVPNGPKIKGGHYMYRVGKSSHLRNQKDKNWTHDMYTTYMLVEC